MNAPTDLLAPVGWVCRRNDPAEIVFRHEEWPGVVRATKESEDLWRVEMTEQAGEAENTRIVGYACTRDRAMNALSTSMAAMNRVRDRTGVVRTMLTSTLALYDDAGIRGVTPEWRTVDRPFEQRLATETPRKPWHRPDAGTDAPDVRDGSTDTEGNDADTDGAGEGPGDGSNGDGPSDET